MNIMQDTAITMYKVLKTHDLWPPPKIESFPAAELPPVHSIAGGTGCMPVQDPLDGICHRHETVAEGILRLVSQQDCQKCSEEQVKEDNGSRSRRTKAWSGPEHGMLKQPFNKSMSKSSNHSLPNITTQSKLPAYPSQSLPTTPFVSLKQEESSHDMPKLCPTATNQYIPPYPFQDARTQIMRHSAELDSMRNYGYSGNMFSNADLPTPAYSEDDFLTDNSFLAPPNSHINNHCQSVAGPRCFENNCAPSSSLACHESGNLQQFLPPMGDTDPPMAPFLSNNEPMLWSDSFGFPPTS